MEKQNFTEITFNQDPDMENRHKSWFENPPVEVALGMTVEELLAPSKRKKSRTGPPRPQQSYILFRKNFTALNEAMEFGNVSSASRAEWRKAPPVVREFFEMLSKEAKKRHYIKYPNYKYEPKRNPDIFRGQKVQKRRGRRPKKPIYTTPESSPELDTAELDTELSTSSRDSFINLNHMFYNYSVIPVNDDERIETSPATSTMTTTTEEEWNNPQDDDGLNSFFDFEFYTTDGGQ